MSNNNRVKISLESIASGFYLGNTQLLIHYSNIRYLVFSFFFTLSAFSAKEVIIGTINTHNFNSKILFLIGAYLFLLIAGVGNILFKNFTEIQLEIVKEIEGNIEPTIKPKILKKETIGRIFPIFNKAILGLKIFYFILLSVVAVCKFIDCSIILIFIALFPIIVLLVFLLICCVIKKGTIEKKEKRKEG